jgi:YidC/Oxa1 family membrane protein insertase
MDTQRLILFLIFAFSLFYLVDAWQRETTPRPPAQPSVLPKSAPQGGVPTPTPSQSAAPAPAPAPAPASPGAAAVPFQGKPAAKGRVIRVETDLLRAEIDTAGGELHRLELLKHGSVDDRKKPFVLFQRDPDRFYVAQSGLIPEGQVNHRTVFEAEAGEYVLKEGDKRIDVRLRALTADGQPVVKTLSFERGSYVIDVVFDYPHAAGGGPTHAYFQFARDTQMPIGDSAMLPTFTGVTVFTDKDKFVKAAVADIEKGKATIPKSANDGWLGIVQHYFVGAWLAQGATSREFFVRKLENNNQFSAGIIVPVPAAVDGKGRVAMRLYAGPQEQENLAKLAPGLDLVVDYGWLTIIAVPLFWLLNTLYQFAGNWGIAIILLTIIIKLAFFPLSAASYRSMAKMRLVTPKLTRIRELYGDDRQRMNQAMMELYKTEKINPLGGCLPIVIQIPVFIALYWVLLASVEMRQAPFYGWLHDLSAPDPFYILPVLMGATMIIQSKLNPEPPDPVQAKIMKIMPIAFSVFFFFFPAGLVLYWLVNNVLSIWQQWHITKALSVPGAHGKR